MIAILITGDSERADSFFAELPCLDSVRFRDAYRSGGNGDFYFIIQVEAGWEEELIHDFWLSWLSECSARLVIRPNPLSDYVVYRERTNVEQTYEQWRKTAEVAIDKRPKTRLVGIVRANCGDCTHVEVVNTDSLAKDILHEALSTYEGKKVRITIEVEG